MKPVSPAVMIKILENVGFSRRRQTGSHVILYKPEIQRPLSVPMHPGDLPTGLQRTILRQAQISLDDFERLLKTI